MSTEKPSTEVTEKTETQKKPREQEIGGYENKPDPTRYGDWETNGRCTDF